MARPRSIRNRPYADRGGRRGHPDARCARVARRHRASVGAGRRGRPALERRRGEVVRRGQRAGLPAAVVQRPEPVDTLVAVHASCTAARAVRLPVRESCSPPPPNPPNPPLEPSPRTQRIFPSRDLVGEPGRADLALAAGEAADAGDVGAVDDRRGRRPTGWRPERAAAVGLDVVERRGEGGVAAERRRRPGRPPSPGAAAGAAAGGAERRRGGPPRRRRPPGRRRSRRALAGPPAGNVPLVAWPSVWTDQAAGAISSVARAMASARSRTRRCRANASATAAASPRRSARGASQASPPGSLRDDELGQRRRRRSRAARAMRASRSAARRARRRRAPTSAAVNGASSRHVVRVEDALRRSEKATAVVANAPPTASSQPVRGVAAAQPARDEHARRPATSAKPSSQPAWPPSALVEQPQRPGRAAEDAAAAAAARTARRAAGPAGLAVEPAEAVVAE